MILTIIGIIVILILAFYLLMLPSWALLYARVLYPRRSRLLSGEPDFPVNVIVPCKGRSEHFEENLRAVATQEYPRFLVSCVTDTADDEAVEAISRVSRQYPNVQHIVAGFAEKCAQKNHVQLVAIDSDPASDIFVVCDSDLRPDPRWLREMVRPYLDPRVLVTGSARWIAVSHRGLGPFIYTGMAAYYPVVMSWPLTPLVWGGCFSISRKAFVEMGIAERWNNTEDDDLVLAKRLAERGSKPVFVPPAVSTSHEAHASVRSLVRWYTRQALTGKLHTFGLWLLLLFVETLTSAALLSALALPIVQAASGGLEARAFFTPMVLAMVMLNCLLCKLPYMHKKDMPLLAWLLVPLIGHFPLCFAIWHSAFMRRMKWGSVVFEFNRDGTVRKLIRQDTPHSAGSGRPGSHPAE